MLHFGDITKISGYTAPIVDAIIGGSPCQDLSIAGKRAGLDGERSGLFMEQLRIIKEMRERDKHTGRTDVDIRPRYMVWENVPGAFSSNKGEDFRIVLEETAKVADKDASIPMPDKGKWANSGCIVGDGWSIAWRILDAQFWGTSNKPLPQRRRRIALVADFGGKSAPEILFVRQSLSGDIKPGKPQVKETPCIAPGSFGADHREGENESVFCFEPGAAKRLGGYVWEGLAPTLRTEVGDNRPSVAYTMKIRSGCEGGGKGALIQEEKSATLSTLQDQTLFQPVYSKENHPADSRVDIDDSGKVQTLTSRMGTGGGNVPMVMMATQQGGAEIRTDGKAPTLTAAAGMSGNNQPVIAIDQGGGKSACNITEGQAPTLTCTHGGEPAVCYSINHQGGNVEQIIEGKAGTLTASMNSSGNNKLSVAYGIGAYHSNAWKSDNPYSGVYEADTAKTLDALTCGNPSCNQGGMAVVQGFPEANYSGFRESNTELATLKAKGGTCGDGSETLIVAAVDCRNGTENADINGTLQSHPNGGASLNLNNVVRVCKGARYIVRRLTPLECERLQGYPDGWTDIGEWTDSNGKKRQTSDAARYKALGNSIALPPWKWVLKRLCACYERDATMASLFDGIGGFPYLWEQLNGKGSCLWASEIEEFPIAVTKVRIGE